MTDTLIREFVSHQRELLDLELISEQDEAGVNEDKSTSQRTVALRQLEASDVALGLYGRTVVQLTLVRKDGQKGGPTPLLPAHRFTVGDDVEIHSKQGRSGNQGGVISAVTDTCISVALFQKNPTASNGKKDDKKSKGGNSNEEEESAEDALVGNPPLTLIPKSSVEVHRKLIAGLAELVKEGPNHPIAGPLVEALFSPPFQKQSTPPKKPTPPPFNDNLDTSQLEAISFALQEDRKVALIHGPPGTGKTTTVAELIQQAVHHHGMKVLVTAPSNAAVDVLLERLANSSPKQSKKKPKGTAKNNTNKPLRMVRLGHPARIKASILSYSLEALVQSHDGTEIVQDVRTELQSFLRILTNPKSRGNDKRMAYREVKSLRKEVRTREEKVVKDLISTAQVVLATTVGAASKLLKQMTDPKEGGQNSGFDLVIIDEAAQALEASCWIPILKGRKLVLAGDHKQLPPTIMCKHSKVQAGLGKTLFERLMKLYGDEQRHQKNKKEQQQQSSAKDPPVVSRMLRVQYRMHEQIANWASEASYHGELLTHESVRHRTIGQLLKQQPDDNAPAKDDGDEDDVVSSVALLLIDTAGCAMHETESSSGSRFNEGEAQLVAKHVNSLLEKGMRQDQIAIITPYNGQVEVLRTMLLPEHPKLEIRSVDGFQGGEREAVVLSLVRSSERGGKKDGIGFLRDNRRLNVAVTRAKRHCAVVCDSETVSQSKFVNGLIQWMEEHGEQRSAMEYLNSSDMNNDLRNAEIEMRKAMAALAKDEEKKKVPNQTDDEAKRNELLDKISHFAKTGKPGSEMALSPTLSSHDRFVVHEFAEQIGLGHRSEGEGEARRIILRIEKAAVAPTPTPTPTAPKKEDKVKEEVGRDDNKPAEPMPAPSTAFAALAVDDDDDTDSDVEQKADKETEAKGDPATQPPAANSMLASLAKERGLRAKQQKQAQPPQTTTAASKKKKKKKVGQKLGGKKPPPQKQDADDGLDGLDDMAFLDAQIEKVQTSHGRKVMGDGKGYKTVINGILISKPPPREAPKNTKASAALQSKLKKAQGDRKQKPNKKK